MEESGMVKREPVVMDCYNNLEKALSIVDRVQDLANEIVHIIDVDFEYYPSKDNPTTTATVKESGRKNLRHGLVAQSREVSNQLDLIEKQLESIIFKLVNTRPKTDKQEGS